MLSHPTYSDTAHIQKVATLHPAPLSLLPKIRVQ